MYYGGPGRGKFVPSTTVATWVQTFSYPGSTLSVATCIYTHRPGTFVKDGPGGVPSETLTQDRNLALGVEWGLGEVRGNCEPRHGHDP